jgi:tripartite-type tricarboxylate transporter receptor subunit TctC
MQLATKPIAHSRLLVTASRERFRVGAGIDAVHVPFKGTPEAVTELLAGRIDYFVCPSNVCLPLIHQKRVLALAMGSSRRSAAAQPADHARARGAGVRL